MRAEVRPRVRPIVECDSGLRGPAAPPKRVSRRRAGSPSSRPAASCIFTPSSASTAPKTARPRPAYRCRLRSCATRSATPPAAPTSTATPDGDTINARFGEQLHTRVLAGAEDGRELSPGQVAAYVAKYSCKASHEQITTRDSDPKLWRERGVPEQLIQMAAAALRLRERSGLRELGRWVHMLGFRGHFVTKPRGYSTTLGELRAARATYPWRDPPKVTKRRALATTAQG